MDNVLYFVDIDGKAVHSYDPSDGRHFKVDTPAKAAAVRVTASALSMSFLHLAAHGSRNARRSRLRDLCCSRLNSHGAQQLRRNHSRAFKAVLAKHCEGKEQVLHARTAVIRVTSRLGMTALCASTGHVRRR